MVVPFVRVVAVAHPYTSTFVNMFNLASKSYKEVSFAFKPTIAEYKSYTDTVSVVTYEGGLS